VRNIPMSDVVDARAEMYVGNGKIEVVTKAGTVPLVRFSQALISDANTLVRRINALAKGEPLPEEPAADEKTRCPRCKRVLPEDSDTCPACLNKRAVLLRLFRFLRPYKLQVGAGLAVLLGVSLTYLVAPYIGGWIVDTLVRS